MLVSAAAAFVSASSSAMDDSFGCSALLEAPVVCCDCWGVPPLLLLLMLCWVGSLQLFALVPGALPPLQLLKLSSVFPVVGVRGAVLLKGGSSLPGTRCAAQPRGVSSKSNWRPIVSSMLPRS